MIDETEAGVAVDDLRDALGWRTIVAAYLVVPFPGVARPRTLLSPEHVATIAKRVRALPSRFNSFRVSAAGRDSDEMLRWRAAVAAATGLADDPDGELLIRLRKAAGAWEVLLRLTPRPLATRAWRTERYPGGLNATVAAAVVAATKPVPGDRFVDLMCGSGTLLIERLAVGVPAHCVGYDLDPRAITITKTHLRNAAIRGARVDLRNEDALGATGTFDKIVVNLPWGTSVGSHADNVALYPAVLDAAARIASPAATLCVLTHDIKVFESALSRATAWSVVEQHKIFQKGHWPRLYVLVPSSPEVPASTT